MTPRLLKRYREQIVGTFLEKHHMRNPFEVPALKKIVVSMGVKEGAADVKVLEQAAVELGKITGQKPLVTRAKKSISAFKLREGQPIGLKVTLRKARMYEFMDRLCNVAMPRIRDFRGFEPKGFDGQGNYNLGIQEQLIFPEIAFDEVKRIQGMNITFVTSARSKETAKLLLEYFGLPFKK